MLHCFYGLLTILFVSIGSFNNNVLLTSLSFQANISLVRCSTNCNADNMESKILDARRNQISSGNSTSRSHFRILVLTHSWGGGTELFEDELLFNKNFEFIFFRVNYMQTEKPQRSSDNSSSSSSSSIVMSIRGMLDTKTAFYTSEWFQPNFHCLEQIFSSFFYHILLINFLHPIPELLTFLKKVNRPLVYSLHDHHAVSYDVVRDMHLDCSITGEFSTSLNISNISVQFMRSTYTHRWEYAELLRRCIAVTTPCLRNKAIFKAFFPEVTVHAVPNRPTLHAPGFDPMKNKSLVYLTNSSSEMALRLMNTTALRIRQKKRLNSNSAKPEIRLVVLGALSIGKGAHVAQDVSNLCSLKSSHCNFLIFHIGSAANFKRGAGQGNHVIGLGSYNDTAHALSLVDSVAPHFIWFPARRHESYCYLLDVVINSQYPIIVSNTGSFPERLTGRPYTYLGDGCMSAKQWVSFILRIFDNLSASDGIQHPSPVPASLSSSYDFSSYADFLHSLYKYTQTYHVPEWAASQPWVEFLALNPSEVFNIGFPDKNNATYILDQIRQERTTKKKMRVFANQYPLTSRKSFDRNFFSDKNLGANITKHKPPYTNNPRALYNRLQWVSASSLLMVWDYLARNLPTYTAWYKSQPQDIKHSKAALLIDPRYSEETFAVTMNIMYNLGPGWNLYIYCSHQCDKLRAEFTGLPVIFRELEDLPLQSAFKVSKWLMSVDMWCGFTESAVLVFQVDSILLKRDTMGKFLAMDYPFIGAYSPGVGADMRTPNGQGMNGGLSLRSPAAMCRCLEMINPENVNLFRSRRGLATMPYNPLNGIYYMEDVYYYHALEMLGYALPPVEVQTKFSVQSAYDKDTMGIHGYDKGWYLTTAQLSILLYSNSRIQDVTYLNQW